MATSKLLKPTNVTISIPEFTDQPDQRVNSNCIDKEADAINTLSEQISTQDLTSGITFNKTPSNKLLQKSGNVVSFFLIYQSTSLTDGDTVMTLPAGCRPSSVTYICPIFDYGTSKPYDGSLWVTSGGACKYYGETLTNKSFIMSGTYVVP